MTNDPQNEVQSAQGKIVMAIAAENVDSIAGTIEENLPDGQAPVVIAMLTMSGILSMVTDQLVAEPESSAADVMSALAEATIAHIVVAVMREIEDEDIIGMLGLLQDQQSKALLEQAHVALTRIKEQLDAQEKADE